MVGIYDWITVAAFAALIVLFLHRSTQPAREDDHLVHYLVVAIALAIADVLGNRERHVEAVVSLALAAVYALWFLRPFGPAHRG